MRYSQMGHAYYVNPRAPLGYALYLHQPSRRESRLIFEKVPVIRIEFVLVRVVPKVSRTCVEILKLVRSVLAAYWQRISGDT